MKNAFIQPKIVLPLIGVCVAGAWFWAIRQPQAGAKPVLTRTETLASLPKPPRVSAVDKEIAKWQAKAQKSDKDDLPWCNLGDALMQKARETADVTYYTHAERVYQKALEMNPKSVEATNGMAWVNSCRHEFEKSIEWANKALALSPESKEAFGLIGDANVEMGDYKAAYQNYQKMLDLRPDISSYSRGAHLLFLTGKVRKSMILMIKASTTGAPHAENSLWCRTQLANMMYNTGVLLAAEKTTEATLKLAPKNHQALAMMGKVKAAQKDFPAAIRYYEQAIQVVPQHDYLVALGDLYQQIGKSEEAEKQYAMVETIHKLQKENGVKGDIQIAQFYADHDRNLPIALKEAEEEYMTRKNVFVADTLAWCYYKNGRYQDAERLIQEAMKYRTPEARFYYHAGLIYDKLGKKREAQQHLSHALSLNPNFHPTQAQEAFAALQRLGTRPPQQDPTTTKAALLSE